MPESNVWNCQKIKINQVIKPDQKTGLPTMLFVYISPISITIIYTIYFALLDNVQFILRDVLSLSMGVFYILILCTGCQILGMGSTHTLTTKSTSSNPNYSPPF